MIDTARARRWILFTRDAHGLHRQFGFRPARHPGRLMEIFAGAPGGAGS